MMPVEPPKPLTHEPAVIDPQSIEPRQDLWLGKDDILEVKFRGSPGYKAYFDIEDVESGIPMLELPATDSTTGSGLYVGRYKVKESDDARNVPVRVRLKKSFWSSENPPYEQPAYSDFCRALAAKVKSGEVKQAIVLVNNATETEWFLSIINSATHVVFPQKRLKFLDKKGDPVGAPLQGQAIIYIGPNGSTFLKRFSKLGWAAQISTESSIGFSVQASSGRDWRT